MRGLICTPVYQTDESMHSWKHTTNRCDIIANSTIFFLQDVSALDPTLVRLKYCNNFSYSV